MQALSSSEQNQITKKTTRSYGWLYSLLFLGALVSGLLLRQQISDYLALYHYQAPTEVAALALQDGFNQSTTNVFYVNHPAVQSKTAFQAACPNRGGEKTIILGCYHGGQHGVFLLKVSDPRLNGVTQVTAAHEVLHAAYERLSTSDRNKVDKQLLDYFNNGLHDDRIKETINGYKQTEPKELVNEMHSIFGTEVASLPPGLESYYSRYFQDRSKITSFAAQYQHEFSSRQATIKSDDEQLAALKKRIESLESNLSSQQSVISSRQKDLVGRRNSGDISGYNSGVASYNALIDAFNQQVRLVQDLVAQYNGIVASRNAIASEISELSNALNTNATQINQ